MRKTIILLLLILLSLTMLNAYKAEFIKGEEVAMTIGLLKPLFIYVTFNNTHIWEKELGQWVSNRNADGENFDKDEMIADFMKFFAKGVKRGGKKLNAQLIDNVSDAKNGYLLHLNFAQVIPTPMIALNVRVTVKIYKSSNKKNEIIHVKLRATEMKNRIYAPAWAIRDSSFLLGDQLFRFLMAFKKGKFRYLPADNVDKIIWPDNA